MKVLLLLVSIWCCLSTCLAINCFTCGGKVGTSEGDACAQATNQTTGAGFGTGFDYCTTVESITDSAGDERHVTRSGGYKAVAQNIDEYTNQCTEGPQYQCTCTSDRCNNKAIAKTTVTCFVCNSMKLFDNGCGNDKLWNPKSEFVHKKSGCSACTKTQDADSITRDCKYSIHRIDFCEGKVGSSSVETCSCTDDECNHSPALYSSFTAYLVISVSFLLKLLQ